MTTEDPWEQAAAYTDEMCAYDERAARTRALLYRLEHKGHKAGWDSDEALATLFGIDYNPDNGQVSYRWAPELTAVVRQEMDRNGGDAGRAVQRLARVAELVRAGEHPPGPNAPRNPFAGFAADEDLFGGRKPGWKFYGYGLRSEAWTTPRAGVTPDSSFHQAAQERRLHEHPDRVEARMVWAACRDGLTWHLMRRRGESPLCIAMRPESDIDVVGNIINALGRLTNAAVGNPVPVRPADRPINPLFRPSRTGGDA